MGRENTHIIKSQIGEGSMSKAFWRSLRSSTIYMFTHIKPHRYMVSLVSTSPSGWMSVINYNIEFYAFPSSNHRMLKNAIEAKLNAIRSVMKQKSCGKTRRHYVEKFHRVHIYELPFVCKAHSFRAEGEERVKDGIFPREGIFDSRPHSHSMLIYKCLKN